MSFYLKGPQNIKTIIHNHATIAQQSHCRCGLSTKKYYRHNTTFQQKRVHSIKQPTNLICSFCVSNVSRKQGCNFSALYTHPTRKVNAATFISSQKKGPTGQYDYILMKSLSRRLGVRKVTSHIIYIYIFFLLETFTE